MAIIINTSNDFLFEQLEMLKKWLNGEVTWVEINKFRSEFYNKSFDVESTRKGFRMLKDYLKSPDWEISYVGDSPKPEKTIEAFEKVELKSDGTKISNKIIEIEKLEDITPELMMKAHGIDPNRWKVVNYTNNFWNAQQKETGIIQLYQSKLVVKPLDDDEISIEQFKEWLLSYIPKPYEHENRLEGYGTGDKLLLLPIVDLHYNMLSTKFISGNDYNCQIAKDRFESVIEDIFKRCQNRGIKKILFPVGNDLFNSDNIKGDTTKGTPQINEKHIYTAYIELFDIMARAIEKLSTIAPIEIIFIPSNHDKLITFTFLHGLDAFFRFRDDISIDISGVDRKYRRFGNSLLMFAHDLKINKATNVAYHEAGVLNNDVSFVNIFLAHFHTEYVVQERNTTIRRLPTISGNSDWATLNAFGGLITSQAFIYSENANITDILYTTVN